MDQDLKDTIKKLEEAKTKQEKIEKIIIILSGLLIIVIFSVIGINIYSGKNETISEPEIDIVAERTPKNLDEHIPLHKNITETKSAETKVEKKEEIRAESKIEPVKEEKVKKEEKTKKADLQKKTTINIEKKVEVKKEKKAVEKKQKKTAPSPEKGFYYVQLGAFSSKKKAEKFISGLGLKNVFIVEEKGLHKVLVGKFKSRKEAYKYMREKDIKGFVRKL